LLKVWGASLGKEKHEFKANLLANVEELDRVVDSMGLDEEG
jgi:hypothetical protein